MMMVVVTSRIRIRIIVIKQVVMKPPMMMVNEATVGLIMHELV